MAEDIKKKVRPGVIELHPEELALVVNYEVQEYLVLPDGSQQLQSSKPSTKKVTVKSLTPDTDIPTLAGEIVDKCKLIHPSKVALVEGLLQDLLDRAADTQQQQQDAATFSGRGTPQQRPDTSSSSRDAAQYSRPTSSAAAGQQQQQQAGSSPWSGSADAAFPGAQRPERQERHGPSHGSSSSRRGTSSPRSQLRSGEGNRSRPSSQPKEPPSPTRRGQQEGQHRALSDHDSKEAEEGSQRRAAQAAQIVQAQRKKYEAARMDDLDKYLEDLYEEDMPKKVNATGMILQLFRNAEHFESLLSGNETLIQTLARILREDGKRSIDLCTNIIATFFSVSAFSQLHALLLDNQVGGLTMDLVELEIKRTAHRAQEEGISPAAVTQKAMEASTGQVQLTDRERKMLSLIQKQDRLLYLCFYLLLNLAEDISVEKKMKKKNVVGYLVKMLERSNVELLNLATTFLKKLSIYAENKQKMAECNVVELLARYVPVRNEALLNNVLRLLHNLSFDPVHRDAMVKQGLIPKAVDLMSTPRLQPVVLGILYHISMEDKYKSMFAFTDANNQVYDMIMRVSDLRSTPELIALAVNLTQAARNAEVFSEGDRCDKLIRKALQSGDELAFKVLRNLSQHDSMAIKRKFAPYIDKMVSLLQSPDICADLFVEVLGCLANLNIPEFDFMGLVNRQQLPAFLAKYAQPGAVDDDILLEVVMFVGVICNEGTADMLVQSGLTGALFSLMGDKREDDEFVLQISFVFYKFLLYEETRNALLNQTQVVLYLIDLLQDKNKEVRRVADQSLDIIMDADDQWATRIRSLKFESYNQEWLEAVARGGQAQQQQQQQQQHQQQAAAQARRQQGDGRAHGAAYDGDEWESDDGDEEHGAADREQMSAAQPGVNYKDFSVEEHLWAAEEGGADGSEGEGDVCGGSYDEDELMRGYV